MLVTLGANSAATDKAPLKVVLASCKYICLRVSGLMSIRVQGLWFWAELGLN